MPSNSPIITAAQCRAGRALIEWTDVQLAEAASVDLDTIRCLEARFRRPTPDEQRRIRITLEEGGVVLVSENGGGPGVRLKFNRPELRAISRWEGEGGTPGEDDIW